ncbi:MAG: DNA mismatch repair protein MutS [Bacteroidia bacterium]|nr:DNA mismatch repair protein MutS [Bacteroidia bacterium]
MSETALMEQYHAIKRKNPGALLLFQVGDFYETFEEDAHIVSSVLGITLTRRNNGKAGDVALAGFPMRALDTYLTRLIEAGYRVAICEQVEEPQKAKKVVQREVTEVVTPGAAWLTGEEKAAATYLAAFWSYAPTEGALALADVTGAGQVYYHAGPLFQIESLLATLQPVEGIVHTHQEALWRTLYDKARRVEIIPEWGFDTDNLPSLFREVYGYEAPPQTIIYEKSPPAAVLTALLGYLKSLKQTHLPHLSFPRALPLDKSFPLDKDTLRHLEVLEPQSPEGKSLFQVLRLTATAAGARLLRERLCLPLRDKDLLEKRLDRLQALYDHPEKHRCWQESLYKIGDLERRIARLSAKKSSPRELAHILFALRACEALKDALPPSYEEHSHAFASLGEIIRLLDTYLWLTPEPPHIGERAGEGNVIREGIDERLDRARYLLRHAQEEITRLEESEKKRLGIPSLKIQENKQLGYVFYITSTHISKIPPEYRLRQHLAQGAARYSSETLDKLGAEIASAQEVVAERETELYADLLSRLRSYIPAMQDIARWSAEVDVYLALAIAAHQYGYVRPVFTETPRIVIRKGRHPVIERFLPPHQPYQPNDLVLTGEHRILLLTGPNMAGKSAYMRQNALILLLAQIGSFVPAEQAEIYPVDQIFSRVGASDNVAGGQSTFLMEMQETARILHEASSHSFVILDEIGRGTSTYDGLAIAWAVLEYLHNDPHCRPWTLFATHYHELTELEKALPRLQNFHLAVEQRGEKLIFLHQVKRGAMRRSFGLAVAEMAGLPPSVLSRAHTLLRHLEKQEVSFPTEQPTLFHIVPDIESELRRRLLEIDPNTITPIEALFKLQELRNIAQRK